MVMVTWAMRPHHGWDNKDTDKDKHPDNNRHEDKDDKDTDDDGDKYEDEDTTGVRMQ
jgi:hypothetical protein